MPGMDVLRTSCKREPFVGHTVAEVRCKMYQLRRKAVSIDHSNINANQTVYVLGLELAGTGSYVMNLTARRQEEPIILSVFDIKSRLRILP